MGSFAPKLVSLDGDDEITTVRVSGNSFEPGSGVWDRGASATAHGATLAMASEVKTLLFALASNVEFLRSVLGDSRPAPEVLESLSDIDVCCERLGTLLEDALVQSRPEGLHVSRSAMTMNGVVRAAVKEVRQRCDAAQIQIEVQADQENVALLDRKLVVRMMTHLLDLSLSHVNASGKLLVRYGFSGDCVAIAVGIEGARSRGGTSSSLDLADFGKEGEQHLRFCRSIAHAHGGTLLTWPEGPEGPTFLAKLPWYKPNA